LYLKTFKTKTTWFIFAGERRKPTPMKRLFTLLFVLSLFTSWSQSEMTPNGFTPMTFPTPAKTNEKLIEASKVWAGEYNKDGYDVTEVTENSLTVSALKKYACYYWNLGVRYDYNIRYTLKVTFEKDTYKVVFNTKEFYANSVLTKTTIPDFFQPNGQIKDDFKDVKPTLEATVDRMVKSYVNAISL
jgi:hypothetical protein